MGEKCNSHEREEKCIRNCKKKSSRKYASLEDLSRGETIILKWRSNSTRKGRLDLHASAIVNSRDQMSPRTP
jgi:hypothetical protein